MLGIIGYAYGNMVLPNFAVGYSDKDYPEFKNSWTKNVVQVDSIQHGRGWIPNAGRTGFGSWAKLPLPKVLGWSTKQDFDFFAGSHEGYDSIGVETYRSVYFIKDGVYIVGIGFHRGEQRNRSVDMLWVEPHPAVRHRRHS